MSDRFLEYRQKFPNWKSKLPAGFENMRSMTGIEALGELKRRGHIRSITLVNAPPRTVSTIIMKSLGESPSLNMQGIPVMHEVLNDDKTLYDHVSDVIKPKHEVDGFYGSDVMVGKLIESGILEKKGVDLVTKIMSHEFTGDKLLSLMPYIDNVVSVLRHPAIHVHCVSKKIEQEDPDDFYFERDVAPPMRNYWKGFQDNVDSIEAWKTSHPEQNLRHVFVNGDGFLAQPQETMEKICGELCRDRKSGVGEVRFDGKMIKSFDKEVFNPYYDPWGANEIKAKVFEANPSKLPSTPQNLPKQTLCAEFLPVFENLQHRFPEIAPPEQNPTRPERGDKWVQGVKSQDERQRPGP